MKRAPIFAKGAIEFVVVFGLLFGFGFIVIEGRRAGRGSADRMGDLT